MGGGGRLKIQCHPNVDYVNVVLGNQCPNAPDTGDTLREISDITEHVGRRVHPPEAGAEYLEAVVCCQLFELVTSVREEKECLDALLSEFRGHVE